MRFFLVSLYAFTAITSAVAQDIDLSVEKIPKDLLKHANAVVRTYHTEINIVSEDKVEVTERKAVTVLNEKGNNYGVFRVRYNSLETVKSVHGRLYDEAGKEIEKLKKYDVADFGIIGRNQYDEERVKTYAFDHTTYPYTVVYEVKTKLSSAFFIRPWVAYEGHDCAIENEDLEVDYPKDFSLRYRTYNSRSVPAMVTEGEQSKITLAVSNMPASGKPEEFAPDKIFKGPALVCVANKFILDEQEGSLQNWNEFGRFFYSLNANRDTLPEQTRKLVHQLTDTCLDTYRKISLLYSYLEKNTRYVNIILGIGGLRECDANYVAEKGYGDCKALSNYMKGLLKEAGITAYQVLVYGGDHSPKMEPDFPYSVFNHVILCVPQQKDTVWLECTAKDLPAGYLSAFTSDRNALFISPAGGYPVNTPAYDEAVNVFIRKAKMAVNDKDELAGSIDLLRKGYWWDKERSIVTEGKSKTDDYFNKEFAIPTYKVEGYNISQAIDHYIPAIDEQIQLRGTGSITRNGRQIYVSPRVFRFSFDMPSSYEARKDSFQLSKSLKVLDTITISFGGAYMPQGGFKCINHDYVFASYHSKVFFDNNTLMICVYYEQKKGVYAPEAFNDYITLSKEINANAAYEKIALLKKE